MSIPLVNPGGWAYRSILTSAQITALDTNITYALDKRAGQTDTLSSNVTVASGGSISGAVGSSLNWSGSALFNQSFSLGIVSAGTVFGSLIMETSSALTLNGLVTTALLQSADFTLNIAPRTSDAGIHNIFIKGQAPFASAVTNINAGNVFVDLQGSLAASTSPANFYVRDSLDIMLSVTRSAVKANSPSTANGVILNTGAGIGMSINTADNNSGPSLNAGGITIKPGTGSQLCGNVAILGGQATASGATPGHITVQGGTGVNASGSNGNAADVNINGGLVLNASNVAGDVNLTGGNASSSGGANNTGGSIFLTGGQGTHTSTGGGHVYLTGAAGFNNSGTSSSAGNVVLNGGDSSNVGSSSAGIVSIQGGEGVATSSTAGSVAIAGGLGAGSGATGGHIFITGGNGSGGKGNIALNSAAGFFGSGNGVIYIATDSVDPSTNPSGGIILYVDSSGNLKARTSAGNVRTIAAV